MANGRIPLADILRNRAAGDIVDLRFTDVSKGGGWLQANAFRFEQAGIEVFDNFSCSVGKVV